MTLRDLNVLPSDLPAPEDDGTARHLEGTQMPDLSLPSTTGRSVDLRGLTTVLFAYPRTGQPGKQPLVPEWDQIAGARGCTPQVCGFRDELDRIRSRGFLVHGVSTQSPSYQAEAAARLHLTFPLLSDESLMLTHALKLPVFTVADQILMKRLALVIVRGVIRKVFYPVFPPDQNASVVIEWLEANAVTA
ncbi:MAG: BcpB protein [Myxococcales bacterium]|nr:BcpB protein [Myxococcales bacterium]